MNLIFIEKYIQKIKKEDIYNYAKSQGINITPNELNILYNSLKNNILNNLDSDNINPF